MGREDRKSKSRPKDSLKQSLSTPAPPQVLLAKRPSLRSLGEFGGTSWEGESSEYSPYHQTPAEHLHPSSP